MGSTGKFETWASDEEWEGSLQPLDERTEKGVRPKRILRPVHTSTAAGKAASLASLSVELEKLVVPQYQIYIPPPAAKLRFMVALLVLGFLAAATIAPRSRPLLRAAGQDAASGWARKAQAVKSKATHAPRAKVARKHIPTPKGRAYRKASAPNNPRHAPR